MVTDLDRLVSLAESQGFTVTRRQRTQHWRFVSPDGRITGFSGTPSDVRAIRNLNSQLRRIGLAIPRKDGR